MNLELAKIINDLIWVFDSPSLVDEGYQYKLELGDYKEQLNNRAGRNKVRAYMKRHPLGKREENRLGYYFEYLFFMGLRLFSNHEVIEENIPVKKGNTVIGEMDVITRNIDTGEYIHWEIAVKFYLSTGDPKNPGAWAGPNPTDTLRKKWHKLISKQLPISRSAEGMESIEGLGAERLKNSLFLKGRLFYPTIGGNTVFPDMVSRFHEKGWWLAVEDFRKQFDNSYRWVLLPKHDWLAPYYTSENGMVLNTTSLVARIRDGATLFNPAQVVMVKNTYFGVKEVSRGFVVPDGWLADLH